MAAQTAGGLDVQRDARGRWLPGHGPKLGRKRGARDRRTLYREQLVTHVPKAVATVVKAMEDGDLKAAETILKYCLPMMRAQAPTVRADVSGATLVERGEKILTAIAAGAIDPETGAQLLTAVGALGRLREGEELVARVAALETLVRERRA